MVPLPFDVVAIREAEPALAMLNILHPLPVETDPVFVSGRAQPTPNAAHDLTSV